MRKLNCTAKPWAAGYNAMHALALANWARALTFHEAPAR